MSSAKFGQAAVQPPSLPPGVFIRGGLTPQQDHHSLNIPPPGGGYCNPLSRSLSLTSDTDLLLPEEQKQTNHPAEDSFKLIIVINNGFFMGGSRGKTWTWVAVDRGSLDSL